MDRADGAMAVTPHVLVVAGSDSSGGAGVVRDIATLTAFGVDASVALTAVTVQTHNSVEAIDAVASNRVAEQMVAALAANQVGAIKIGMLATVDTALAVSAVLEAHPGIPVVLDPVLASTSGRRLLADGAVGLASLFHQCALITPNLPELAKLTPGSAVSIEERARLLLRSGVSAVLVKGGHGEGTEAVDTLFTGDGGMRHFASSRLSASMRGTGCALASAIAAGLASGRDLVTAIAAAKAFVHERIARGAA